MCHSVYLKQNYKMLKSLPQDEGGCVVVAVAAEHWVKVGQRKPEKHKVDQDGETDFVFSFFVIFSSATSQTASALDSSSISQSHLLFESYFPSLLRGRRWGGTSAAEIRWSVAFSCCVCSVCTTSFLCLSPCDCTCWVA